MASTVGRNAVTDGGAKDTQIVHHKAKEEGEMRNTRPKLNIKTFFSRKNTKPLAGRQRKRSQKKYPRSLL